MKCMARVTVMNNVRARVEFTYRGGTEKEQIKERKRVTKLVDDALAIEQKGSHFNPVVQSGLWDGRRHLFYADNGTFAKGLSKRVKKLCREAGYVVLVTKDERTLEPPAKLERLTVDMLHGEPAIALRDYQMDAIENALKAGSGLLWIATNGGKTEIASAIIMVLKEKRALFLVGTRNLLSQARERLARRLGTIEEHIGVIGDGKFDPKHVTVATVQSLTTTKHPEKKKLLAKYLKTIQLLFGDEVHHAKARTWLRLINRIPAQWRFGLSGTPYGGDDNGLIVEGCFGPVVARVTNDTLIQRGHSARPTIKMIEVSEPKLEVGLDWRGVYEHGIVRNVTRNNKIAQQAARFAKAGKPCLIMVRELLQGDQLSTMLRSRNVKHAFVHGKMPTSAVDHEKARFEEGKTQVLIASPIFDEGVDVPAIKALIIGDGGQSIRKILQQIGRGLREKKDGSANEVDIVDFADTTHHWLAKHSQERLGIYEAEKFKVTT